MPRRSRSRAEDRIAQLEAKLAAEQARRPTYVPYNQRMHEERWALLSQRLREADAMQAEGAPPEKVVAVRIEANERFRLGDFQYEAMKEEREAKFAAEAAVAPPPIVQSTEPVTAVPRPAKPRKPLVDKLADYRGTTQPRWLEPEFV